MKIIIYGIGKSYNKFMNNLAFVTKGIIEKELDVVGVSDGSQDICGRTVIYNGHEFDICKIEEFNINDIDYIVVTTKVFFDEIRANLIKKGYRKKQILLIDWLYNSYLDDVLNIDLFTGKAGIEIGGPTGLFNNIYRKCLSCDNVNFNSNTIWCENKTNVFRYKDKILGNFLVTDATDMHQIKSGSYDFVLSSNNLEHIANPLKALKEFARITNNGGIVLIIVPMKERTFDHNREYTDFEHILADYENEIGENDLSHLSCIIEKHDYSMDIECGGKERFIERAKNNIENRCLHHHVFGEECLRKSFNFVDLEVIKFAEIENNWLIVGRKAFER